MPRIMAWLEVDARAMASSAGVYREILACRPESSTLQNLARDIVRVTTELQTLNPASGATDLAHLIKNYPLKDFGHKTMLELVVAGRTNDVVGYLESFEPGFVG